ncbi:MAG: NAD(P)H-dependent oxidoreductase [Oscillospiraceae bacterium]|nr:NAD(P)H-dependent oxidoreductase [Oscillospiraceae bacterium]
MKKIFLLAIALCMAVALTACGAETGGTAPQNQETTSSSQSENDSGEKENVQSDETLSSAEAAYADVPLAEESDVPEEAASKVLVAYFSCTNNTEGVALKIAEVLDADTYEIIAEQPYTDDDLNYNDSSSRSTKEQNDDSCRPAISGSVENMGDYDIVVIGYPIWWGQAPKIMYTFMESYDFSEKTVVPFCTSASSGVGSSAENLHSSASDSVNWLDGTRLSSDASEEDIVDWLNKVGLN